MSSRRARSNLPMFSAVLEESWKNPRAPRPLCDNNPAEFVDYATPPSTAEAAAMCAPCPLRALCLANARHTKPAWGVLGGIVWVAGRQSQFMSPDDPRLQPDVD